MIWNAENYLQFAAERTQPALDLITRLRVPDARHIIDIGCGPGNSTAALRNRWPDAEIIGLDNSPPMIESARNAFPEENWILADAANWTAHKTFDVVFSNAALQWLKHHETLIPYLLSQVSSGGALAVQMPAHHDSGLHRETLEVAENEIWCDRMESARLSLTKHPPAFYYDLLQPISARIEIWETEYIHVLENPRAILNWFRATGLRPFLEVLNNEEKARFESLLLEKYERKYPRQKDGRVLFAFRRLFFIAYKSTPE